MDYLVSFWFYYPIKQQFVRSATMERTPVTGQLNCYSAQQRGLRSSMVNLIVNFFEKINDVNLQEAERSRSPRRSASPERSPPRYRTPTYTDFMLPDETIFGSPQIPGLKTFPTEQRRQTPYGIPPTVEDYVAPSAFYDRSFDQQEIKAIPIKDTLSTEPPIPSYESAVKDATINIQQNDLLDSIHDYRMSLAIESRRLYQVFDRYQVVLKRQLQMQHLSHSMNLSEKDKQQVETLISEANKVMNEVRRHQTETAQHLSFLDNQRETIMALTSDNGSPRQYTQQAYMRILTTFIQPIFTLLEEAKVLRKALQDYEAWLIPDSHDRLVRTAGLSPIARMGNMLMNHVKAYSDLMWNQVSRLHSRLHDSLEEVNRRLEILTEEDREEINKLSLVSPSK